MDHHSLPAKLVLEKLRTSSHGLSQAEAARRLVQFGPNEIKEKKSVRPLAIFLGQFRSFVIGLLIAATAISFLLGEVLDAFVILAIIILNGMLGFFQEYRAEKTIEALRKLTSLKAIVFRDGKEAEIPASQLVPGDVIRVETGQKVPADGRILEAFNLQTQEASLTGESLPLLKDAREIAAEARASDRTNMLFSSTIVVAGHGNAVVTQTGMQTEIGKIAALIQQQRPEPTPLQVRLKKLGTLLGSITVAVCIIVFISGVIKSPEILRLLFAKDFLGFLHSARDLFLIAVSLAVAAIPEGLPVVVTIGLALGVRRMAAKNVLIRKLPSVETLGSTTVICSDKTGTLTKNEMTVKKIYTNGHEIDVTGSGYAIEGEFLSHGKKARKKDIEFLMKIGSLCNDARFIDGQLLGDPTEGALLVSAAKAGLLKESLEKSSPRLGEIGFTSERKRMSTQHRLGAKTYVFTKGAPDIILGYCDHIYESGRISKLTLQKRKEILAINQRFASEALRVLGFAFKHARVLEENGLVFIGLQAMIDPAREEVKGSIQRCKEAGIKVVMITGDHLATAQAIAKDLAIEGNAMEGAELAKISQKELEDQVERIGVYARVNPTDKMKIVEAFKSKGEVVAMTGDGVNDAPSLKRSDIGIAMGVTGTDVAKEASHMILTDDNFASIVHAIEEGRGVYDNLRKFIAFLLSGNIAEVLIIFFAIISGLPLPLAAIQLLVINLVTDGLPATALSADPFEPRAMKRRPVSSAEKIYGRMSAYLIYYPCLMTLAALSTFLYFINTGQSLVKAQTAVFLVITFFELYQAFSCRSLRYPVFKVGIFKNRYLNLAVVSSFLFAAAIVFIPSLNPIFKTAPLTLIEFGSIIAVSSAGFIYLELSKALQKPQI